MVTAASITTFPPPPTYAEPTIVDARTGKSQFNPIWLRWFLEVAQILSQLAVGANSSNINHEKLAGLLGGDEGGHYHISMTQYYNLLTNPMTAAGDLIVGGTAGVPTRLPAGAGIGTKLTVTAANTLGWT